MAAQEPVVRRHGNAYNIFILVLTIYSLVLMVVLVLPLSESAKTLANFYDNVVCVIFLIDFTYNITGSRPRRAYFIGQRGWLDLLGSIPTLGFFQLTALLRLARLSRLGRIARLLRGNQKKELIRDVVQNRGQYAMFITILLAGIVLSTASEAVLQFESASPDANIVNPGDAIWWSIVTITTVGYGDFYPVTSLGRITAAFLMFAGIGVIGALASILASVLVTSPSATPAGSNEIEGEGAPGAAAEDTRGDVREAGPRVGSSALPETDPIAGPSASSMPRSSATPDTTSAGSIAAELAGLRAEVAALRESMERQKAG